MSSQMQQTSSQAQCTATNYPTQPLIVSGGGHIKMVEDPAETARKMIGYLDSAFIGYCHLNMIKPPQGMVWGTRNDQEVHHTHEMNLEANFDEIGI